MIQLILNGGRLDGEKLEMDELPPEIVAPALSAKELAFRASTDAPALKAGSITYLKTDRVHEDGSAIYVLEGTRL